MIAPRVIFQRVNNRTGVFKILRGSPQDHSPFCDLNGVPGGGGGGYPPRASVVPWKFPRVIVYVISQYALQRLLPTLLNSNQSSVGKILPLSTPRALSSASLRLLIGNELGYIVKELVHNTCYTTHGHTPVSVPSHIIMYPIRRI